MSHLTTNITANLPSSDTALALTGRTALLDKFMVDTMLLETVQCNLNEILPCLIAGVDYTATDLIGAELWADWTPLAQRQAHICLKHLATLPGALLTDMACVECGKTSFQIGN